MEFLVEVVGEIVSGAVEWLFESQKIPRIVKLIVLTVLLMPWTVFLLVLCIRGLTDSDWTAVLLAGFCVLLLLFLYIRGLFKLFRR